MSGRLSTPPTRTVFVLVATCMVAATLAVVVGQAGMAATPTTQDPGDGLQSDRESPSETGLQDSNEPKILHVEMRGRGLVTTQAETVADHPGYPYVWESESLELQISVRPASSNPHHICGRILNAEGEAIRQFDCVTHNSTATYIGSLQLEEWPANTSEDRYIELELVEERPQAVNGTNATEQDGNRTTENVTHDVYETKVFVINKEGDRDGDGLMNAREVELGTDFTRKDTSGDGLTDWEEVQLYGTDPLKTDTTGDGVSDGTIAQFGLPPTVPYVLHAAAIGSLLVVFGIGLVGVKLRNWLRSIQEVHHTPSRTSGIGDVPAAGDTPNTTTKEEEILTILQQHGGQMRQTELVEESEWSKATVSRLLSSLEEEGHVEKIRVGRGNVVKLHDSPFENGSPNVSG